MFSCAAEGGMAMGEQRGNSKLGPTVFIATVVASLVFSWWFLIYDHGVPGMH